MTHLPIRPCLTSWTIAALAATAVLGMAPRADAQTAAGNVDRGRYLALVTSAAHGLASRPSEAVADTAVAELRRFFPAAAGATVLRHRVLKERSATPRLTPAVLSLRPGPDTAVPNLVLAGDWTDTGLPATLEGAALSGHRAAARCEGVG